MKIWITTDTHFNHSKMIEYCGRPENFEEIIKRELSKINKGDMLIHLGDVCIGNDEDSNNFFMCNLQDRNVRTVLCRGNHDSKSNNWYLQHGWDFVCKTFTDKFFGKKVIFSHEPVPVNEDIINIHGHFHNALPRLLKGEWKVDGEKDRNEQDLLNFRTGNHKLLALEYTEYKPVDLEKFLKD